MQKAFIIMGILFIVIGLSLPLLLRLGLGHLPGDIIIKRANFSFYFPITTSIVLSIIFSLLIYLFK